MSILAQVLGWLQGLWEGPDSLSCSENCSDGGYGVDPDG